MSAEALPISTARFATALHDLPISALHAKITEIQNSIAHLSASNAELEAYVRQESDEDCYEALMENKQVIARMEERIELVRKEITEVRGLPIGPVRSEAERVEEEGAGGETREAGESGEAREEVPDHGLASESGVRGAALEARARAVREHQAFLAQQAQQTQTQGQTNGTAPHVEGEDGVYL